MASAPLLAEEFPQDSIPLPSNSKFKFDPEKAVIPSRRTSFTPLARNSISYLCSTCKGIFPYLLPSFIITKYTGSSQNSRKLHPTAYLDGIRGVASFVVFIHHYLLDYFPHLHHGFAASPDYTSFLQFPFVRTIYAGRFAVPLFFVLSGYVLSYKPIRLIHDDNGSALLESISSSIFRRGMRLFLPVIPATYYTMIMIHNGWHRSLNRTVKVPAPLPLWNQTAHWSAEVQEMLYPFTWQDRKHTYGIQLWTLPIEFRASLVIFLTLLGLSKAQTAFRMFVVGFLAVYSLATAAHWEMSLFFAGIMLAELNRIQLKSKFNLKIFIQDRTKLHWAEQAIQGFWVLLFMVSWFLGCWPDKSAHTSPGYVFLTSITPSNMPGDWGRTRFWATLAAPMMLLAMENFPMFRQPFLTPCAQYLGHISFAMYIVHSGICYSFGRMITLGIMDWTGVNWWGFMLAALIIVPLVIWIADVYWRLFDVTSVNLARWVWNKSLK